MLTIIRLGLTAIGIAGLVAACAPQPQPQPIHSEPTFDKYGNPECRPADRPISEQYPERLPRCDVTCPEGGVYVEGQLGEPGQCRPPSEVCDGEPFQIVEGQIICRPDHDDDDDDNDRDRTPNDPGRGDYNLG
ncbi:hypothetical protein C2I36_05510 [Rhodobacteraceae bacterium WD3A24]|nr:hypothetical protein C2I36_05510 [Rhodobacteraceae bacterium WD3A24]